MDCWDQVLLKAARLSRTYGVADRYLRIAPAVAAAADAQSSGAPLLSPPNRAMFGIFLGQRFGEQALRRLAGRGRYIYA